MSSWENHFISWTSIDWNIPYLILKYEDLVNNSESEIKKLLSFCELTFDENCLKHHENKRVIKTISFNQARKPIYKTSLGSYTGYENYLTALKDLT